MHIVRQVTNNIGRGLGLGIHIKRYLIPAYHETFYGHRVIAY